MTVLYPTPRGAFQCGSASYRYAHAAGRLRDRDSWTERSETAKPGEPSPGSMTVPQAVARAREEGLHGFDAVGRVASLAAIQMTDAVERLHAEDRQTQSVPRVRNMSAREHVFFASERPDPWGMLTPEQRRAMAERHAREDAQRAGFGAYDRDGRGNYGRR